MHSISITKAAAVAFGIFLLSAFLLSAFLLSAFLPSAVLAVPGVINYQGYLSDGGGPVSGAVSLDFQLYDAEFGGSQVWTETHDGVVVSEGVFNVLLGSVDEAGKPLDGAIFTGAERWLEIVVDPGAGEDILSPRKRITSAGYALRADKAATVDAPLNLTANLALQNAVIRATNSGGGYGLFAESGGIAIYGKHSGGSYGRIGGSESGVYGYGPTGLGNGVVGIGLNNGVFGRTANSTGAGVYGSADATRVILN